MFNRENEIRDFTLVSSFFQRAHEKTIMKYVIEHVLPYRSYIKEKNLNFFLENTYLFSGLGQKRIDYYTNEIVHGTRVTDEDRDEIWEYFQTIVAFGEKFLQVNK